MQFSPAYFQIYSSRTFRGFPSSSRWFPLVSLGYQQLSLVIPFAYFKLSFPSFAEIFCCRGQLKYHEVTRDNQGKQAERVSEKEPAIVQIYSTSIEEFIRITRIEAFLESPQPIFVKVKSASFPTYITAQGLKSQNLT